MIDPQLLLLQVRSLFKRPVGVGVRTAGNGRPIVLAPLEEQILSPHAVERRRRQFGMGRAAARDALVDAGSGLWAVGRAEGGEPIWPAGFVGSITHTAEAGIAVVARRCDYRSVGIDLENISSRFHDGIARQICTPAELAWVRSADSEVRTALLFSSKEAVFKAIYPLEWIRLGFKDAELVWNEKARAFSACLLRQTAAGLPPGTCVWAHYCVSEHYVFSAVGLEDSSEESAH